MFLLWGGTACCSLGVATAGLPLGLGGVRIASDADLLDHWMTHGYSVPPLEVHPREETTVGSSLGIQETSPLSKTD